MRVRVDVKSSFSNAPERTLVAEFPGSSKSGERIVIAAHLQEPGASDNASGTATLMEMAESLAAGIAGDIYRRLGEKNRTWRIYFHDVPQTVTLADLWVRAGHFHRFDEDLDRLIERKEQDVKQSAHFANNAITQLDSSRLGPDGV